MATESTEGHGKIDCKTLPAPLPTNQSMQSTDYLIQFFNFQLCQTISLQAANRNCPTVFDQGIALDFKVIARRQVQMQCLVIRIGPAA